MSAYYHGGRGGLMPGAFILPPTETGAPCTSDYHARTALEAGHRRDRVYVTTDPDIAFMWAALSPCLKGSVYVVEPSADIEPDPDCMEPGRSFQCGRAKIVRVIYLTNKDRKKVQKALGVQR